MSRLFLLKCSKALLILYLTKFVILSLNQMWALFQVMVPSWQGSTLAWGSLAPSLAGCHVERRKVYICIASREVPSASVSEISLILFDCIEEPLRNHSQAWGLHSLCYLSASETVTLTSYSVKLLLIILVQTTGHCDMSTLFTLNVCSEWLIHNSFN